ncbi:RNA-binding protein 3 [Rhynchospora pubera]|uniref:RNA-binding protein 3 n=1 Tax=Rhynchospora pubera TaxID=906938 RepID=A0AAV8CH74_9POAL|nr:RNA-binding protein 3 [Rhynchospora pubera]
MPLLTPLPSTPPPPTKLARLFTPTLRRAELSLRRRSARACSSPGSSPPPLYASTAGALSTLVPTVDPFSGDGCTRWTVSMERPPPNVGLSRAEVIDYYVDTLARVLGSEKEAQMCIYYASWQDDYCFKCDIDEEQAIQLSKISGVLSVMPDTDGEQRRDNYMNSNISLANKISMDGNPKFSKSSELNQYWLVQTEKPDVELVTKAQVVDYYAMILTKVLGNEKDAQVSLYRISWEKDFWFCCQIEEQCAHELADLNEVLSVEPDSNFSLNNKNYGGLSRDKNSVEFSEEKDEAPDVRTKRLFVTGLSFYTSEKTLRAAFEGFGELVEVKVIMDRISKRSKGYAFIEYTTEEAAAAALKEMNGKIINGWMIVVDVARANPPPRSGGYRSRP